MLWYEENTFFSTYVIYHCSLTISKWRKCCCWTLLRYEPYWKVIFLFWVVLTGILNGKSEIKEVFREFNEADFTYQFVFFLCSEIDLSFNRILCTNKKQICNIVDRASNFNHYFKELYDSQVLLKREFWGSIIPRYRNINSIKDKSSKKRPKELLQR